MKKSPKLTFDGGPLLVVFGLVLSLADVPEVRFRRLADSANKRNEH